MTTPMNMLKQNRILLLTIVVPALAFFSCGQRQQGSSQATSTVVIMMPENDSLYREQMIRYVQEGGEDPVAITTFIPKEIQVPAATNPVTASAHAAAEAIYPSSSSAGGAQADSVVYFRIHDSTAYILLGMDIDGWTGVSCAVAIVRPVVEKTLLQFPQIRNVMWDSIR